ncbi:MAG: glucuronate isomerase [Armatimonadota bacterium]
MSANMQLDKDNIRCMVIDSVQSVKVTDIHTHLFSENFGSLLLWGIDELLTYHYLVAETMRWIDMPYDQFWSMSKKEQADLIWQTLFIDHSPVSEACRGILTTLQKLGLDTASRNLDDYRAYFAAYKPSDYIDRVFELAGVESVVMTNDPFDNIERPVWTDDMQRDGRFHAVLRIDALLNTWDTACTSLIDWGYAVQPDLGGSTFAEVQRFLSDWIDRMDPLYMAASLSPTFMFPEESVRGKLIQECILPVGREKNLPFAMMIGVKKLLNPQLRLAGDAVGKSCIDAVEHLCANYPVNKFLVTMLSRENQHELCVAARKFRNLMVFGCWWFLNIPYLIDEMTRMRLELLGTSMIPQHSDARVLDQLVYKWDHSRKIIAGVLVDKYIDLAETGWKVTREEIDRDVADLFGGNFWSFLMR